MLAIQIRPQSRSLILLALFFLLAALFPAAALSSPREISIIINGQPLNLDTPPLLQDGRLLAPVHPVGETLQARVKWNEATNSLLIKTDKTSIILEPGTKEAIQDGKRVTLDVPVQHSSNGRIMVPLRFLAEALGATVAWDEQNLTATITTPTLPVPERIGSSGVFPARVAFTANNNLYLLDGSLLGNKPVQVTREGAVEILGWSPDGQWLAYLQREMPEEGAAKPYLWVVKADGGSSFQVDAKPVLERAAWSPAANILAYSTQGPGGGYAPDLNLKLAAIASNQAQVTALLPDKSELVQDFAWAPDGQSLAISLGRTKEQPLRIDRLTLQRERNNLLTRGEASTPAGQKIYSSFATGLQWSPNGRYLAYYLHPNSSSLSADGVALQLLDLEKPGGQPLDLGTSLHYREWLAWSPDGNKLACIQGSGREATANKHLCVVTLPEGKIAFYDQPGRVDTQPLWLPDPDAGVLFCRGLETTAWEGKKLSGVLVSDHRIWLAASDGHAQPLTANTPDNADYYPSVSPDGQDFYFLRLDSATSGSLYRQPLAGGPAVELVRNINGGAGYYGNYYPAWINIYHLSTGIPGVGR